MNVVIDTSIWSLALRRNVPQNEVEVVNRLQGLIVDGRVIMLGAIRQELLSGIRYREQFDRLRNYLRAFPNLELTNKDYELAAEFFNTCRSRGIQGANTDFLICAVAHHRDYSIFTTDKDFESFQLHIPIVLH